MTTIARQERLMSVLLGPHVSEKSTAAAEGLRQVVFRVRPDATKSEIKQAVELLFEVKVDGVTSSRVSGKSKRFGTRSGKRSDWKKAYVRLAPGYDLEFLSPE
ncbi:MAG TPA: 50S ribosomal protein L23 [Gammaproteobacteria bacterium]|nr:50S ribosomal protein L23 [Gammaproteobacteria bacterium]